MTRIVLDGTSQMLRLSGVPELEREVEWAVERALEEDPGAILCSSQVAYREFLRQFVIPFLVVRDVIVEKLFNQGLHEAPWSEIVKVLDNLEVRPRAGSLKSLPLVKRSLRERYPNDPVPIRRAITFLDASARDLAERHFFRLRLKGEEVHLLRDGESFLAAADCLSEHALRSRERKGSRCLCQLSADATFCPRSKSASPKDPCLDASESPMRCCSHDQGEACGLETFLDGEAAALIERLLEHARTPGFPPSFRAQNARILAKLEVLRGRVRGSDLSSFKNETCAEYFSEVLTLLECGNEARLLSYDEKYDELARALGWNRFRIDPQPETTAVLSGESRRDRAPSS